MTIAALGPGLTAAIAVLALVLLIALVAWRFPPGKRGSLPWDPEAATGRRHQLEQAELDSMLELHNAERARRGLAPRTLQEYREHLARSPGAEEAEPG